MTRYQVSIRTSRNQKRVNSPELHETFDDAWEVAHTKVAEVIDANSYVDIRISKIIR